MAEIAQDVRAIVCEIEDDRLDLVCCSAMVKNLRKALRFLVSSSSLLVSSSGNRRERERDRDRGTARLTAGRLQILDHASRGDRYSVAEMLQHQAGPVPNLRDPETARRYQCVSGAARRQS